MPLAAKTANDKPNGQLALKLSVKNNEAKTVRLKNLKISFIGSPPVGEVTLPIQVKDKDDDQMKDLEIEAGKTAKWFFSHENHIILPIPAPGTIKLSLSCDVFDTPATVTMPLGSHKSPTPAGSYSFPAQVRDLRVGEYWSGRSTAHKPAGDGSQLFGYDMGVMAWDTAKNDWNGLLPGKEGDKNEHYRIWDKPICAMADGTVVDFKNDMPNNTKMGKQVPTPSPVEGNHFYIQHGDELVVYAHLQPGSLNSKFMKKGASVKHGDFLGLAGNSGNSTNPSFAYPCHPGYPTMGWAIAPLTVSRCARN